MKYVARTAVLVGSVHIGEQVSIWDFVVARGDTAPIHIAEGTNVQEGAILHTAPGLPVVVGVNVTIGHRAVLHGCRVGDGALIGIGAIVLNHAEIGAGSIVAAGAVVTEGTVVPPLTMVAGVPAMDVGPVPQALEDRARRICLLYQSRAAELLPHWNVAG